MSPFFGVAMKARNVVALVLVLVSLAVLIPGLTQPLITIRATMNLLGQSREIFSDTRSIIQTIRNLHESGNDFVAGLILLFSVIVPFVKALLLGIIPLLGRPEARFKLFLFVRSISKWAMVDVFVVGIWVAFLAGKAADHFDAMIEPGFYYFVAYCVISLVALQLLQMPVRMVPATGSPATGSGLHSKVLKTLE
jgi:paraquat-inducible protein A